MKRTACVLASLTLGFGVIWIVESGAADVYLEATRPDFQKISIGILGIRDGKTADHLGDRVEEVLAADLRRSQVFSIADLVKLGIKLDDTKVVQKAVLKRATENGVAVVVWGQLSAGGPDLALDGYVYDGNDDEVMAGKRYIGAPSVLRLMAHRLADELVFRYTGEAGIARTKIAFVSEQAGGRELFVMDYDGYGARQVTSDGFLNLMPRWSPDRRFLAFTAFRDPRQQTIDLIELATGKRWTLISLPGLNITPAWSPDGTKLAFATSQDGNSEIYTFDTRTKALERLTTNAAGDLSPTWSPSGRELAFTSDRGGGPQIYLMGADGSNIRRLTFEGDYNASPAWSPRGSWIAYVCRTDEKNYKLCLITPDGQKRMQITTGPSVDDSPSWSPDGRHLVFSSTSEGQSHIYMTNSDGTDRERITSRNAHHSSPSWSPAG